jgi:iron complex transport system substrate-binding protein
MSNLQSYWQNLISSRVANLASDLIPSVYIEGYSDDSANGKGSGVDQELDVVKGKNIAASLGEQWPKLTAEWVLSQNHDVIIKAVSLKPDKTLEQVRDDIFTSVRI